MKLLRWPELIKVTGLSKRTIERMILNNEFPEKRKVGKGHTGVVAWLSTEIDSWMQSLPKAEPEHGVSPIKEKT